MTNDTASHPAVDSVLLDVDGTLIDSSYHHALAWNRAFAAEGLECELWRTHRAIGMGGDHLVEHLFDAGVEERLGEQLREGWQREYKRVVDEVRAFSGAHDLVALLRARGLKVALASSSPEDLTERALEIIGLAENDLDAVTTANDAENAKPSPDILQVALDKVDGRRGLMVGDSIWDVEAAKRLGIDTVCVLSGGFGRDELTAAGAVLVVDTVADLLDADWDALTAAR